MWRSKLLVAAVLCLVLLHHQQAIAYDDGWRDGRATRYGGLEEPEWNIHRGSCGYGYLDKDKGTGRRRLAQHQVPGLPVGSVRSLASHWPLHDPKHLFIYTLQDCPSSNLVQARGRHQPLSP